MRISIGVIAFVAMFFAVALSVIVAFVPTYVVGVSGVRSSVAELRVNTIQRAAASLLRFFGGPERAVVTIESMQRSGVIINTDDIMEVRHMLCGIQGIVNDSATLASLSTATPSDGSPPQFAACQGTARGQTFGAVLNTGPAPDYLGNLTYFPFNATDGSVNSPVRVDPFVLFRIGGATARATGRWRPVSFSSGTLQIGVRGEITTKNGTKGQIRVNILTQNAEPLLRSLGLRSRARAFVYEKGTQRVLATSWGADTFTFPENATGGTVNLASSGGIINNVSKLTDELVVRTMAEIGGEAGLEALPAGASMDLFKGKDKVFLDVADFTDDIGLNVRVMILMPEYDYLEETDEQQTRTIIGVVCAAVAFVVIALLLALLLRRPLQRLGARMQVAATLADISPETHISPIAEVADIQLAFESMRSDLQRVKAFLPQGIMRPDDDSASFYSGKKSESETSFNNHTEVEFTTVNPNPLSTSAVNIKGKSMVDTKRLVAETPNRFVRRDCSVALVSFAYGVSVGSDDYNELLDVVMDAVVAVAAKSRGVVEWMRPDQVLVSFGARHTLGNSALHALRFAMALSNELAKQSKCRLYVLLDRGSFLTGVCGTYGLRHQVIASADLSILQLVAPAMVKLKALVVATGRIEPSLQSYCIAIPTECVQWDGAQRVHLYEVVDERPADDDPIRNAVALLRRGFSQLCSAEYAASGVTLKEAAGTTSTEGENEESPRPYTANRLRIIAGRLCSLSASLRSSTIPYCKRYLGWASVEAFEGKLESSATTTVSGNDDLSPGFDTKVDEQLDELGRRDAANKSVGVFKGDGSSTADAKLSAALFEMAFTATMTSGNDSGTALNTSGNSIGNNSSSFPLIDWRRGNKSIGSGAFGKVYRALNANGTIAAMKVLPLASVKTNLRDVQKELQVVSQQQHDNVVAFLQSGIEDDELIVTTEFMAGGSLMSILDEFGALSFSMARRVLTDVLRGLAHLHSHDIVHCDVKPHNILLGLDGVSKLADFGSALHQAAAEEANDDESFGSIRGTPAYCAPQVAQGHRPTKASDIWSFGVLAHELTTGRLPFNNAQLLEIRSGAHACIKVLSKLDVKTTDKESLTTPLRASIPSDIPSADLITDAIQRCLELDPSRRPSCDALLSSEFLL